MDLHLLQYTHIKQYCRCLQFYSEVKLTIKSYKLTSCLVYSGDNDDQLEERGEEEVRSKLKHSHPLSAGLRASDRSK